MSEITGIHLRRLHVQLGEVVYEMTKLQLSRCSPPQGWCPAVNVYRCQSNLVVCVDLAGVNKSDIGLEVERERAILSGYREAPEPQGDNCKPLQVLGMEIDYGAFEREIPLPVEVDPQGVTAEQKNGLLWIYLPIRSAA